LGEALGRLYVERTFGADGKATMRRLVQSLVDALEQDIAGLDWMTAPTKQRALEKLRLLDAGKIGYPDVWRDYASVRIARDDYAGNRRRVARFDTRRAFDAVGKPVDQREWLLSPPSVNAYYHPQLNEIVFPAGILQPPFFDRRVDKAVNLGAIGSVIGHELTHGFDDEGRAFDGAGNLSDWWTDADARAFQERASCLGRQYSGYSPVKDPRTGEPVYLNPDLTMGENIGDNGGVRIAYLALENTLENGSAEVVEGYTPEQRFFLGFAQISCQNMTDAEVLRRIATDPHSANRFRVNGPLRNLPEFQKAFGCATGTPMAPADRCRVW
jgi:endothelin-converting enzyme/putative endopeptidase